MATTRPNSDVTITGWTPSGAASVFDTLNEVIISDTDYVTSPAISGISIPLIMGLDSTLVAGTYYISIRAKITNAVTGYIRISLLNSSNVVQGVSAWQTLNSIQTTHTIPVTISGNATRVQIETSSINI